MVSAFAALLVACGRTLALRRNLVDFSAKQCAVLLTSAEQLEYAKMGSQEQMSFMEKAGCVVSEGSSCGESAVTCLVAERPERSMCCHYNTELKRGYSVTNLFDQKFEILKDGWTPLVQIPRTVPNPKLLVSGNIQPFTDTMGCEASRISDLHFSGSWLSENVTVRSGGIESSKAFGVRVGEGSWQLLSYANVLPDEVVSFSKPGVKVQGKISTLDRDSWGPDATLQVDVGNITVDVAQRTLGRFEESRVFLDISVRGKYDAKKEIGGWLGMDGENLQNASTPKSCVAITPVAA
mmetsp:Transcript_53616/g.143408  ORF Transcript_53616/g.143408 Transcript_53616/m.143408 type:complete len:294 (-) Transcript_53616:80-961(-)